MTAALSESELAGAAETLARELAPGAVVWLQGELGTGKTTFAQAFARARGVREPVTSPTFTLVHRYEAVRGPVFHVDCYRFRRPEEAADLDWESMLLGDALLVEWPERATPWVPEATVNVAFRYGAEADRREVEITRQAPV